MLKHHFSFFQKMFHTAATFGDPTLVADRCFSTTPLLASSPLFLTTSSPLFHLFSPPIHLFFTSSSPLLASSGLHLFSPLRTSFSPLSNLFSPLLTSLHTSIHTSLRTSAYVFSPHLTSAGLFLTSSQLSLTCFSFSSTASPGTPNP